MTSQKEGILEKFLLMATVLLLQVFAVRSGGATGVVVKGPDDKSSVAFRYTS